MLIFSASPAPATSASAVSLSAGGPTGININAHQSIGSSERSFVFVAKAHMLGMLMLRFGQYCLQNVCRVDAAHQGQMTKRISKMTVAGFQGNGPLSSPFFMLSNAGIALVPAFQFDE